MLDLANDIRSLSDFKRNTAELLDRLRKTGHPLVLTINGKAEVVVQDAGAYQALLDASRPSRAFSAGWPMSRLVTPSLRGKCSIGCAASMAYRVDLARNAEAELEELYLWVVERAPQQGERAVLSLDQNPERRPVALESIDPDLPVRLLSYGRTPHVYRVFFPVDDNAKVVRVVHVRRGARRRPSADELTGELAAMASPTPRSSRPVPRGAPR